MSEPVKSANDERDEVLGILRRSCTRLLSAVDAVAPELSEQSAAEGRWSVLQCLEHVVNSEEGMLRLWQKMSQPGSEERTKDELIRSVAPDRSRPRQAPERVVPQGRIKSVAEARERFVKARAATLAAVEEMPPEDLRGKVVPHPLAESVDGYQLFHIMALHSERHAQQIDESAKQLAARSKT
jgi:uncharacterized damage-inducible protein DinB